VWVNVGLVVHPRGGWALGGGGYRTLEHDPRERINPYTNLNYLGTSMDWW